MQNQQPKVGYVIGENAEYEWRESVGRNFLAFPTQIPSWLQHYQFARIRTIIDFHWFDNMIKEGRVYHHRQGSGLVKLKTQTSLLDILVRVERGQIWIVTGSRETPVDGRRERREP